MKRALVILLLVLSAAVVFASGSQESTENTKISVFTSLIPQKFFVEKIGGDKVEVNYLVGPGKSPATYEPTPDQVIKLGKSDLLFTIGVPFEAAFLPAVRDSKKLRIVDTSEGIQKRHLEAHSHEEEGEEHHDEHEIEHEESGTEDPHIWLSPSLVIHQSEIIRDALKDIDPENSSFYDDNYNSFTEELQKVSTDLSAALKPFKGETIFVYHPAFGYFCDEFNLHQEAIETGGKEPSAAQLTEIIEEAKADGVKILFVQPEFAMKSAKTIADAIGGVVISLNPLSEDYINNLYSIADEVKKAF